MTIRVRMVPHLEEFRSEESGIKRVIEAYFRHLPNFDVELVGRDTKRSEFDLLAVHAGAYDGPLEGIPLVAHNHGLYFTADHETAAWEWRTNKYVINSIRHANEVTVPSSWVAETFQRDMRFTPHIIPHGIDWEAWQGIRQNRGHVLWNKNRDRDVCDPASVKELAERFPDQIFLSTFKSWNLDNILLLGEMPIPFPQMKEQILTAGVYLSSTKETFGVGTLEAMASGVPILGFAYGGNLDLVQHGVNGYLAEPGNFDDLAEGLNYCLEHRNTLGENGREMARKWTWERACEMVAHVYELAIISNQRPMKIDPTIYMIEIESDKLQ